MVLEPVLCPACGSDDGGKHGQSETGQQRYKGRNRPCHRSTFMREDADRGYLPAVKQQTWQLTAVASEIRPVC